MKTILFVIAGLAVAIFLLTYAANNLSQPGNSSVWMGVVEIVLAILLLTMVAGQIIKKLKASKN